MIDFEPPPELAALARRTAAFVREEVVPYEGDPRWTGHGPTDELRAELVERARGAGLLSPHVATEYGGAGLSH
ncbi:MAG TPA: acyl-CoA dehydrogenase family protein, partial [Iamia sp.]|nr:acyl-CoA dehydrogenase family protein [Iamia sp.]